MELLKTLSLSNQSLLNQVRSKDLSTLAGLETVTRAKEESDYDYTSTDEREMQAYYAMMQNPTSVGLGESLTEEELDNFRQVL